MVHRSEVMRNYLKRREPVEDSPKYHAPHRLRVSNGHPNNPMAFHPLSIVHKRVRLPVRGVYQNRESVFLQYGINRVVFLESSPLPFWLEEMVMPRQSSSLMQRSSSFPAPLNIQQREHADIYEPFGISFAEKIVIFIGEAADFIGFSGVVTEQDGGGLGEDLQINAVLVHDPQALFSLIICRRIGEVPYHPRNICLCSGWLRLFGNQNGIDVYNHSASFEIGLTKNRGSALLFSDSSIRSGGASYSGLSGA